MIEAKQNASSSTHITRLSFLLACIFLLCPISFYVFITNVNLSNRLNYSLNTHAAAINDFVARQPDLWDVSIERLRRALEKSTSDFSGIRITNAKGTTVFEIRPRAQGPYFTRSISIYAFGQPVGSITEQLSIQGECWLGLIIFFVSLACSWLIWGQLRKIPLAALLQAETALLTRDRYQRALLDNFPFMVWLKDSHGRFLAANTEFFRLTGQPPFETLGNSNDVEIANQDLRKILQRPSFPASQHLNFEEHVVLDGRSHCFEIHETLIVSGSEQLGVVGYAMDITDRKTAENTLRSSEALLRNLKEHIPDMVWLKDIDGKYLTCNQAFTDVLGLQEPEIAGRTDHDLVNKDMAELFRITDKTAMEADGPIRYEETLYLEKDGRNIRLETIKTVVRDSAGTATGVLGIARDVTERVEREQEIKHWKHRFDIINTAIQLVFYECDLASDTVLCTGAIEQIFGIAAETHSISLHQWEQLLHPDDAQSVQRFFGEAETRCGSFETEYRLGQKDGRYIHVLDCGLFLPDEHGKAVKLLGILRDISESKRMQEMMVLTEKMISVGGMAAGIAHEINNPLGIIMHAVQNIARRLQPNIPKNKEVAQKVGLDLSSMDLYMHERSLDVFLEDIQTAGVRASEIVRRMLNFSRTTATGKSQSNLRTIIDNALTLANNDYDLQKNYGFRNIHIQVEEVDGSMVITCNATEIEQVFLNLLRNSAQAIGTAHPSITDPTISIRSSRTPTGYQIVFEDNGPGMPAEIVRRVFEPFFTTKAPGAGTGLGLSVSYFIITKGHGGTMRVKSRPGQGTRFIIDLPTEELSPMVPLITPPSAAVSDE